MESKSQTPPPRQPVNTSVSDTISPTLPMLPGALPSPQSTTLPSYSFIPKVGNKVGVYRLKRELGRGGMGVVYQAWDEELFRDVALKLVLPDPTDRQTPIQKILAEARAAASLVHDHVVTIHHVGEHLHVAYIAMQYLEGTTLSRLLRRKNRKPLDMAQIVRLGKDVACGLDAAHQRGLIHSDIKPGNIWLEAPKGRVKILDFGIARSASHQPTINGQVLEVAGTPEYMSPEQSLGLVIDFRSDLFSLGCVLYELLVGFPPFQGPNTNKTLELLQSPDPAPLQLLPVETPVCLQKLIAQLLQKNRDLRPQSTSEVHQALRLLEKELISRAKIAEAHPEIVIETAATVDTAETPVDPRTQLPTEKISRRSRRKKPKTTWRRSHHSNWTVPQIGLMFLGALVLLLAVLLVLVAVRQANSARQAHSTANHTDPCRILSSGIL